MFHHGGFSAPVSELGGYKAFKAYFEEDASPSHFKEVPATVLPTPFSRQLYELAVTLAVPFNRLCNSMVLNIDWLLASYEKIRQVDDFVRRFVDISRRVYIQGPKNIQTCLKAYVTRSDYLPYMSSTGRQRLGQVEINLSSVVGPDVCENLTEFHRDMLGHFSKDETMPNRIPLNRPRSELAKFFSLVHNVYSKRFGIKGTRGIVLFVMGNTESNWAEIFAEIRALRKLNVFTYNLSFDKLTESFVLGWAYIQEEGHQRRFMVDSRVFWGNQASDHELFEVVCVYWRTAYTPEQLPTERHWQVREFMELSDAAVIPSAISQLAGLKKVQQLWCDPKHLDLLVINNWEKDLLRTAFVDQVDPSAYRWDKHTQELVDEAMEHPDRFVLKPQREGGANNHYHEEIPPILQAELKADISSFILMRKIPAMTNEAAFIVEGSRYTLNDCVSELGIFAAGLWNGEVCEYNQSLGHLLRTKPCSANEGGVCIGAAVFDSPYLCDELSVPPLEASVEKSVSTQMPMASSFSTRG